MDHRDAVNMLRNAPLAIGAQRWADLGCGTGTFTRALADLLPPGSSIAAMDRDASALEQVPEMHGTTRSTKHTGDFATGPLPETSWTVSSSRTRCTSCTTRRSSYDGPPPISSRRVPSCSWSTTRIARTHGCRILCPSPRWSGCSRHAASHRSRASLSGRPRSGVPGCIPYGRNEAERHSRERLADPQAYATSVLRRTKYISISPLPFACTFPRGVKANDLVVGCWLSVVRRPDNRELTTDNSERSTSFTSA